MTIHPHPPNMAITQGFDLVILAGGAATRLGALAQSTPKSLLLVQGRPCVMWQIESMVRACPHIRNINIVIRARDDAQFKAILPQLPRPTILIHEHTPVGTGGAIKNMTLCADLSPLFFVMNGDVLFTPTPYELLEQCVLRGVAMQYVHVDDTAALGVLDLSGERITSMQRGTGGQGAINAGLYAFERRFFSGTLSTLNHLPTAFSFEDDVVPHLIKSGNLGGVKTIGRFIDIGTPSAYVAAQSGEHKILASQS